MVYMLRFGESTFAPGASETLNPKAPGASETLNPKRGLGLRLGHGTTEPAGFSFDIPSTHMIP